MAAGNRYSSGLFVTPPSPGYPGIDFFGSIGNQPATYAPSPRGGGAVSAINATLPGGIAGHHAIAIALVVFVGFGIYWWASKE